MAPFMGPSRASLLASLQAAKPKLPITLGWNEPQAVVDRRDGMWVLAPLVMNGDEADAAAAEALAEGRMWMPEMTWRFLEPGEPLLAHADKDAFLEALAALPWRWGPT